MDPAAPSWEQHLAASLSHFPAAGAAAGTGEVPVLRQICSQPKTYPEQGDRGAVPRGLHPRWGDCTKLSVLLGMGDERRCCSGVCLKRPSPAISSQLTLTRCRISHRSVWQLPLRAGRVPWAGRAAGRASGSDRAAGKIQAMLCTRGIRRALGAFGLLRLSCSCGIFCVYPPSVPH